MNRKLGITKGKTCLINGKINVLLTQLIPNEDSVSDPEWDQPRETFFPIRSIYYSCDEQVLTLNIDGGHPKAWNFSSDND